MSRFFALRDYLSILDSLFRPDLLTDRVESIDLDQLKTQGYQILLLDIDNTVLRMDERKLSLQCLHWIERAKMLGFLLFFISNNSKHKRVELVCEQAKVSGRFFSCKPFPFSICELLKSLSVKPEKVVVVGDQLFTDVLVSNWIGAYSVLVDPLDKRLSFFKTLQRQLELSILGFLVH
ncbi:MAG: YqeG family HAD IIIA-type phosphatase [bacterium]